MTTSATAAAAAKIAKPKTGAKVSHANDQDQAVLPLPVPAVPEFGQIDPNQILVLDQVRTEFDEASIAELAEDIAARGILQPLSVRYRDGQYVLVAGERRLRAAKLAKLTNVPVMISTMSDQEHKQAQLAENIQREDLTLVELARAIQQLYEELGNVGEVAARVKKSKSWVSKRLSLANGLGHYASALLGDGISEDMELLQAVDKLDKETQGSNSAWALCEKIRAGKAGRTEAREALQLAKTRKEITIQPSTETQKPEVIKPHQADRLWEQYRGEWLATHEVGKMYAIAQRLPDALHYGPEMMEWKDTLTEERVLEEQLANARKKRRDIELRRMNFIVKFHTIDSFRAAYDQWQKEGGRTPEIAQEKK